MTLLEYIDIFWWSIHTRGKAYTDEYKRLYSLMETGKIKEETCYNNMVRMIEDPYYFDRPW